MAGGKRRPHRTPIRPRHVSTVKPTVPRRSWNTTSRAYSVDEVDPSRPIHFASSSTVAFVDPNPNTESTPVPSYNYDPALVGELGLGFHDDEEVEEEETENTPLEWTRGLGFHEEEEEEEEETGGGGFITIGGVRVYAEDTSSPDDDDGTRSESEESDEDEDESDGSSSSSGESDGSEIDDELAEDYIEMIGGRKELLNSGWLSKNKLDGAMSFSSNDEEEERLGAVDMMNASAVYGMKKKSKSKKGKSSSGSPLVEIGLSAALDDLMFAKDPRSARRRRGKKEMKAISQLSRSWPREGQRSKEYYGVAGIIADLCKYLVVELELMMLLYRF